MYILKLNCSIQKKKEDKFVLKKRSNSSLDSFGRMFSALGEGLYSADSRVGGLMMVMSVLELARHS